MNDKLKKIEEKTDSFLARLVASPYTVVILGLAILVIVVLYTIK
jgi:hypothetical protein